MNLGNQVKKYREKLGIKAIDLEDAISNLSGEDVPPGTISALEKRGSGKSKYARYIAQAFGLTLDELLDATTDWIEVKNSQKTKLLSDQNNQVGSKNAGWPFKSSYQDFLLTPQPVKEAIEYFISIASSHYPISNDEYSKLIDLISEATRVMRSEVKKKKAIKS